MRTRKHERESVWSIVPCLPQSLHLLSLKAPGRSCIVQCGSIENDFECNVLINMVCLSYVDMGVLSYYCPFAVRSQNAFCLDQEGQRDRCRCSRDPLQQRRALLSATFRVRYVQHRIGRQAGIHQWHDMTCVLPCISPSMHAFHASCSDPDMIAHPPFP